MGAVPEGPGDRRARVSRFWIFLAVVFVGYLAFRMAQGVVWLVEHA
ncbi:hypothetical protein ACFSL4_13010 [Streptomyces caeni]|uniref:AI-2E family transporter n=1 Tax=Streptomyces caeni TaxID=2307231 RepID=A0ABW4IP46_9ACTN